MAGVNLASSHFVHSSVSERLGRDSAKAFVRCTCASTIFRKAEGVIECCQCLQSMQTTRGFLHADNIYFTSVTCMFEAHVIGYSVAVIF